MALGNLILQAGIIEHVMQDHGFENARYYYQFIKDKPDHGSKPLLQPSMMGNIAAVRYQKYTIFSWPKLLQLSTIHVLQHDVTYLYFYNIYFLFMQVSWQHLSEGYLPVPHSEKRKDVGVDISLQSHLETGGNRATMSTINEGAEVMKIGVTRTTIPTSTLDPYPALTCSIDYSALCCLLASLLNLRPR